MTWQPAIMGVIEPDGSVLCLSCSRDEASTGQPAFSGSGCWEERCRACGRVMETPLVEADFKREESATRAVVSDVLKAWAQAARGGRA